MADIKQDDLMLAATKWAEGRKQKDLTLELWIMLIHTIGTLQTVIEHFGLTEITAIPTMPQATDGETGTGNTGE